MKKIAVFIDRDGTINEDVGYVNHFDRFRILPGVPEAIRRLNRHGIPTFLVTNQSGVARGYFSLEFLGELHRRMVRILEREGCRLDGIYLCPHHPDDRCACRKPRPGMLLKAAHEHPVLLYRSYVIGDKMVDIELAHSVGAKGILVLTGYGAEELRNTGLKGDERYGPLQTTGRKGGNLSIPWTEEGLHRGFTKERPDHVSPNLNEAVDWILKDIHNHLENSPRPSILSKGSMGEIQHPRRILIVKPSSLGDVIHGLPLLWSLRRSFPDATIGWVIKDVWKEILEGNPLIDEIIVLKKGVRGILSAIKEVRRGGYETVIDIQGLFRSALISLLCGARNRIGFSNAREFAHLFYNIKASLPGLPMHAVDRYLSILDHLEVQRNNTPPESGNTTGSSQFSGDRIFPATADETTPLFPLYIEIEDSQWARNFLMENGIYHTRPLIAINPSARWEKKRWPSPLFASLINRLIQKLKAGIIILGSEGDIPIVREISSLIVGRVVIAAGRTSLKRLTALLDRMDILVTNDSGPMHIAAALGKPVIALFGPTDPRLTGPYGDGHTVIRKKMECSPCFRRPCRYGHPICMESISVGEVIEAVEGKLARQ